MDRPGHRQPSGRSRRCQPGSSTTVAGFGCVFIDADYPQIGPSRLAIYDGSGAALGSESPVSGVDGSQLFGGLIAVDDQTNQPVAAIARVHLVNGDEWPPRHIGEGVVLDDFVFGPLGGGTTTTTTTTLPDGACAVTPTFESIGCRLAVLATTVGAATDLGRLKSGLVKAIERARNKVARGQELDAASKTKPTRRQLKKAGKTLKSFVRRLASRKARNNVPEPNRAALTGAADPIASDLASLAVSF